MSKVKQIIDLWDTERLGNDVEYHYVTPEMGEDQEARALIFESSELETFIEEAGLNEFQIDVDKFRTYDSFDYLVDNWKDVTDQYWDEVVAPRLEQNYREALAYKESFIKKAGHDLTDHETKVMNDRIGKLYGISFGKEAA